MLAIGTDRPNAATALGQLARLLRHLEQPGQDLAERRRDPGAQQPPPGGQREHRERDGDNPGQHVVGPSRRLDRCFRRGTRDRGEHDEQADVQDKGHHLGQADAGRRDRRGDLLALQIADVQRGPAHRGGGDQRDE
jgi:hypothetical protein